MNFGSLLKAVDAVIALRQVTRRDPPPPAVTSSLPAQIETRLTTVVVAALKEAFDRDHARLELERSQLEAQARRAEEAMRAELRRHSLDREMGRLRLLAGTAMVGWIASMLLLGWRIALTSTPGRVLLGVGWVLLLAALGAAFAAMGRLTTDQGSAPPHAAAAPMWLLIAGLACSAITLLL